jgi:hypothetical protein
MTTTTAGDACRDDRASSWCPRMGPSLVSSCITLPATKPWPPNDATPTAGRLPLEARRAGLPSGGFAVLEPERGCGNPRSCLQACLQLLNLRSFGRDVSYADIWCKPWPPAPHTIASLRMRARRRRPLRLPRWTSSERVGWRSSHACFRQRAVARSGNRTSTHASVMAYVRSQRAKALLGLPL